VRPAAREDAHGLSELLGVLGYPCPPEEAAQRVMALRHDPEQTLLVAADSATGKLVGLVACDVLLLPCRSARPPAASPRWR
jgi:hypothetical protein